MERIRITNTEHHLWEEAWQLYKKSFPPQERRQLRTQKKILDNPLYHFELITDRELFAGFVLWWGFDDVRYIEHLATSSYLRGKGYGRDILQQFISDSDLPVLLEVEHPTDEISRRRIGFYQRSGFVPNEHSYTHPPYKKGGERVSLMLMTYPGTITESDLARFIGEYHPIIHRNAQF